MFGLMVGFSKQAGCINEICNVFIIPMTKVPFLLVVVDKTNRSNPSSKMLNTNHVTKSKHQKCNASAPSTGDERMELGSPKHTWWFWE